LLLSHVKFKVVKIIIRLILAKTNGDKEDKLYVDVANN